MKSLNQIRNGSKPVEKKYMSWNNKIAKANEGTMGSGIFDDDKNNISRRIYIYGGTQTREDSTKIYNDCWYFDLDDFSW